MLIAYYSCHSGPSDSQLAKSFSRPGVPATHPDERLGAAVRQFSDREPEVIIAELYDSVLNVAQGTPQQDDLTAVLIKRSL